MVFFCVWVFVIYIQGSDYGVCKRGRLEETARLSFDNDVFAVAHAGGLAVCHRALETQRAVGEEKRCPVAFVAPRYGEKFFVCAEDNGASRTRAVFLLAGSEHLFPGFFRAIGIDCPMQVAVAVIYRDGGIADFVVLDLRRRFLVGGRAVALRGRFLVLHQFAVVSLKGANAGCRVKLSGAGNGSAAGKCEEGEECFFHGVFFRVAFTYRLSAQVYVNAGLVGA